MQFQVPIHIKPLQPPITYQDAMLIVGSCFTEHIGNYLSDVKFKVLQNPNGILFDPLSVCNSLVSYIENKRYSEDDLFYCNEAWHSWNYHTRFSNPDKENCLHTINQSQQNAHQFLQKAEWLIITLGSAFTYQLLADSPFFPHNGFNKNNVYSVANCHKVPAPNFKKYLCTIEEIITAFDSAIFRLFHFNPNLKIIFTISPVRHLRDGVTENNRSKARLIEAVHHLVNKFDKLYYFPSYELVIDVLRDYRFYDIDLAHPNYAATQFVLEHFFVSCVDAPAKKLADELRKISIAKNHKPFNPASEQHRQFLQTHALKIQQLQEQNPYLDLKEEWTYFTA